MYMRYRGDGIGHLDPLVRGAKSPGERLVLPEDDIEYDVEAPNELSDSGSETDMSSTASGSISEGEVTTDDE